MFLTYVQCGQTGLNSKTLLEQSQNYWHYHYPSFSTGCLAHLYVPVLFQKWIVAIPVLVLICLSATTTLLMLPLAAVGVGKSDLDLRWNVLYCYVDCWIADWSSLASC